MIDQISETAQLEELWKKGHHWIQSPEKDFLEGQKIFSDILAFAPDDYWATLLLGGCFTWASSPQAKNPIFGETYVRKAIAKDPDRANGYALLAQNCLLQGKYDEVIKIATSTVSRKFPGIESDQDQQEKILEVLECAKQVMGLSDAFKVLVQKTKTNYPQLAHQLTTLSSPHHKHQNCLVM